VLYRQHQQIFTFIPERRTILFPNSRKTGNT